MYMVQAWLVFFTLAHTSSHSCTHKIFYNIQKYVIYIVYILSTYSILLLLNVFGCIKITQIHNYQKSKISTHDDQSFSNSEISKFWIKILFSISCLNFRWYINPVKIGTLFCFRQVNMYCFVYSIKKFTILFPLDKGVSPRIMLQTLKPILLAVFL